MSPKPEQPQNISDQIPIDKTSATVQEAPAESSDEDAEEAGAGYQYHLVGQEPHAEGDIDDEDEDDISHLSIAEQVQALVAQAQSQPENLSPATQGFLAESSERQEAELRREKAEIWAENKLSRDIDLNEEKVDAIKNIMKNFSLPSSNMPTYLAHADQTNLTEKLKTLKRD